MGRKQFAADHVVLGGHGADDEVVAIAPDSLEFGDSGEVDQMARLR